MSAEIELRQLQFDDKRVGHLLGIFDNFVRSIRDYNGHFSFSSPDHEKAMLASYRDSAFGVLFSLFQLGHITTTDFHMRMQALYTIYFDRINRRKACNM